MFSFLGHQQVNSNRLHMHRVYANTECISKDEANYLYALNQSMPFVLEAAFFWLLD